MDKQNGHSEGKNNSKREIYDGKALELQEAK